LIGNVRKVATAVPLCGYRLTTESSFYPPSAALFLPWVARLLADAHITGECAYRTIGTESTASFLYQELRSLCAPTQGTEKCVSPNVFGNCLARQTRAAFARR